MRTTKQKLNGKKLVLFSMAVSVIFMAMAVSMLVADDSTPYVRNKSIESDKTYQLEEMETFQFASATDANGRLLDGLVQTDDEKMTAQLLEPEADLLVPENAEVPEPATVGLIAMGAAMILVKRRKNRG